MRKRQFFSHSEDETRALGKEFSKSLAKGSVVALFGSLGAGKTVFVQGLAEGCGVPRSWVKSPSFTLIRSFPSAPPFYHVDLFRLSAPLEEDLGLEEIFTKGIVAIEWAEKLGTSLPSSAIQIRIERKNENARLIEVEER